MRTTSRRRGARAALAVLAAAVLLVACSDDADPDESSRSSSTTTTRPTTTESTTTTTTAPTTTTIAVEGETSRGVQPVEPHRAIYKGGKLYLEGTVPTRKVGDELKARASEVIGPENVVDNYRIDPAAPAVTEGRVVVDEPFLFATGSAAIQPGYESLLNLGVVVMQLNPQVVMVVRGYTDDVGDEQANLALSQARAQAVADWIAAKGIDPGRFRIEAHGEADPVGDNATPEGKALNRRIEVELLNLLA
jgi:outer membrane protein OmpA-like peptidoglycan-associated protein